MSPRVSVTTLFFVNGTLFASYFARLPAIQERVGLSEGELGLALVGGMIGLIASQPAAAALAARFGAFRVLAVGALGYCAAIPLPGVAPSLGALFAAGVAIGTFNGALDVITNTVGVEVERRAGRPILSSFHAAFSFGALAGAIGGVGAAAAGVEPIAHLGMAGALGAVASVVSLRGLRGETARRAPGHRFALPRSRPVLLIGAIAFCTLLAEGAVNDWSAVYLATTHGTSDAVAAAGLATFNITMALMRLAGDRLTDALGPPALTRAGGVAAAVGGVAIVAAPGPGVVLAGLVMLACGLATIFPLAIRAAAERAEDPATGIAAVSTLGYGAFVTGPPLIGGLAELVGLRSALVLLIVLAAAIAALAYEMVPVPASTSTTTPSPMR